MEFLILRLLFINPVSLPIMTESYLRKDFHFALYLSYCYGKVLSNFFRMSVLMLFINLPVIIVMCIIFEEISNDEVKQWIWLTMILIAVTTLILIKGCLTSVEKKLIPGVFDENGTLREAANFDICFNRGNRAINPFLDQSKLPRMCYLNTCDGIEDLNSAERDQFENDDDRKLLLKASKESEIEGGG